jgi:hypothetical protein
LVLVVVVASSRCVVASLVVEVATVEVVATAVVVELPVDVTVASVEEVVEVVVVVPEVVAEVAEVPGASHHQPVPSLHLVDPWDSLEVAVLQVQAPQDQSF